MKKVVITGMGVICATASNQEEFAQTCLLGQRMLSHCDVFDTQELSTPYFGEATQLEGVRIEKLLASSLTEMMADANITKAEVSALAHKCPMFIGSIIFQQDYLHNHSIAKSQGITDDNLAHLFDFITLAKEISGLKGQVELVASSCASGTTVAGMGLDYIRAGICECAIVGAVDPLDVNTACGFNALHNMSQSMCKPFDENRDGLNIGEGGAFFFLESEEHAKARGVKILCELAGSAISNDAYHLTSPDPEGKGAKDVMLGAIKDAGLKPEDIDYINAHGTGTLANDSMEFKALNDIFGHLSKDVYYSSTKGSTGHCMGAAGAVELAASIIAIKHQQYLPMPYVDQFIQAPEAGGGSSLKASKKAMPIKIEAVLSNSFAFSGHNAAIVIKKYS